MVQWQCWCSWDQLLPVGQSIAPSSFEKAVPKNKSPNKTKTISIPTPMFDFIEELSFLKQQFLYLFPLPQWQESFLPIVLGIFIDKILTVNLYF